MQNIRYALTEIALIYYLNKVNVSDRKVQRHRAEQVKMPMTNIQNVNT